MRLSSARACGCGVRVEKIRAAKVALDGIE